MRDDLREQVFQLHVCVRRLRCTSSRWAACASARSVRARRKRGTAGERACLTLPQYRRHRQRHPATKSDWLFAPSLQTHRSARNKQTAPRDNDNLVASFQTSPAASWTSSGPTGSPRAHVVNSFISALVGSGDSGKGRKPSPAKRCCTSLIFAGPYPYYEGTSKYGFSPPPTQQRLGPSAVGVPRCA